MPKQSQSTTRAQGDRLARSRLEGMGYRIMLSDERGISFHVTKGPKDLPVRVKTIRYGNWRFTADALMDISISEDGIQTIHGRKTSKDADLVCILVKLDDEACYVLTLGQLHDVVSTDYEAWLEDRGGRRPRKPESMHCAVGPHELTRCEDNWGLIRSWLA
jgi:hypothetical protein